MPWVKIDDHFDEHPKMQQVGPIGWGFWLAGLAYCNRNLTDGFIPWSKARTLCSFEIAEDDGHLWELSRSSGMVGEDITAEWVIGLLIDAGLWEEVENGKGRIDGYRVHDYPEYQPTKEQVLREREQKAAAGRAGGQASAQARAQAGASPKPKQAASSRPSETQAESNPVPVPVPDPQLGDKSPKPPTARKPTTRIEYSPEFEAFWQVYPSGHGVKKDAYAEWQKIAPDDALQREMIAAVHGWMQSDRWKRGYVKDAERWVKGRMWENVPPAQSTGSLTVVNGTGHVDPKEASRERWRRKHGLVPDEPADDGYIETQGRIAR